MGNQLDPEHADNAAPRIYQSLDGFSVRLLLDPHDFSMIRSDAVDLVIFVFVEMDDCYSLVV